MAEKNVKRYKLVKHKWPDEIQAQRNKRLRIAMIVVACVACFCGGFLVNNYTTAKKVASDPTFEKLTNVYDVMKNDFYFGKDKKNFSKQLINGAIDGMVNAGGDSHTNYMTPSVSKSFSSSMAGSYVGIGVQYYAVDENTFMISKVFKSSPAEEAGFMPGDIIYAVGGKTCAGMDIDKVKELITGETGTKISIEIVRNNEHITKDVVRRAVANTVTSEIRDNVGLIQLDTFADTSGEEFGNHLKDIAKSCKNLVIDLRNNGGGYLIAAQQIASYLLPKDSVVFQEKNRDGSIENFKTLKDTKRYAFEKVVVIVNGDTASAAEVLSLALKENIQATIVGEKTYGKGTIQLPLSFKDGSSLKYTTAKWLSPSGKSIDKKGIAPDVEVVLDPAMSISAPKLNEGEVFKADSVNVAAESVQTYLKFLGYKVDRSDAYFSPASSNALKAYQRDNKMEPTGEINGDVITSLLSKCSLKWHSDVANDTQLIKAMEIANGN